MAFAEGKSTAQQNGGAFKRWIGVASCEVLTVNPDNLTWATYFNSPMKEEPVYTKMKDIDGKQVNETRLTFLVRPTNVDAGVMTISFFVQDRVRYNKDKTKIQVIDKYARTAWATIEEAKAKKVPMSKSGTPLKIDKDYRPIYVGEENLTKFIKRLVNIPDTETWNKDKQCFETYGKLEDCEARFESMEKIAKGDVKEIKEILKKNEKHQLMIAFGIRINPDGKEFQTFFADEFWRVSYDKSGKLYINGNYIDKQIVKQKDAGLYSSTDFRTCELQEYSYVPTQIMPNTQAPAEPESDLPF